MTCSKHPMPIREGSLKRHTHTHKHTHTHTHQQAQTKSER